VPIQYAEGAVSWNGFLKQVGFDPPTVYEVSGNGIILEGEHVTQVELLCLDGDWVNQINQIVGFTLEGDATFSSNDGVIGFTNEIFENPTTRFFPRTAIGLTVFGEYFFNGPGNPGAPFDIPFTDTTLCLSPSSMMTIGGEWQPTDTTALIIGYSVLNAYWIAPIGIGIGVGVYLTRNRWQRR